MLGTFVEIGILPEVGAEVAIASAFNAVDEVQRLLSFHDPKSDLSRLNNANGKAVTLSPLSLRVLRLARAMTSESAGYFNCTVGGAMVRQGILPNHGIKYQFDCGGADDIVLSGTQARLRRPILVTLDGMAKGYAVDCAIHALRKRGVKTAWVNAGGDMRAYGEIVLPVHRRELDGALLPLGGLHEAALATSCVRTTHDLSFPAWIVGNPRSPKIGVWSVMANSTWRADALTKVAAIADANERMNLIVRLGGRLVAPYGEAAECD